MKCKEYKIEIDKNARIQTPENAIFFDIETTGLKKETSILSVIACGYYEDDLLHIFQWINDDAISEEAMLKAFLDQISTGKKILISYNGDAFDLPFLKLHLEYNDLSSSILEELPSMDLYRFLHGFPVLFALENGTQKAWEDFLGLTRVDTLEGKQIIKAYKQYLKNKEEKDLNLLLLHNLEDIRGLAHLMALLPLEQLQEGNFEIGGLMENRFDDAPAITFSLEFQTALPHIFEMKTTSGQYEMPNHRIAFLTIPCIEENLYHFYENYQDYYYLPLEDRAIHKSVGAFVDQEHRQKASAKNCYIRKEALFLPFPQKDQGYGFSIPAEPKHFPLYRRSYESKELFIDFDDLFDKKGLTEAGRRYLKNILASLFLEKIRS